VVKIDVNSEPEWVETASMEAKNCKSPGSDLSMYGISRAVDLDRCPLYLSFRLI